MKPKLCLIWITLIFVRLNFSHAQYADRQSEPIQNDTLMGDLPESINEDLLSLLESWHIDNFTKPEENCLDEETDTFFPDSIYRKRMQSLPFLILMNYNETVRKCIDLYAGKMRNKVRYMMGMSCYYFPMIEQKLDKAGLPVELKYLTIVESALNPVARSHKGACGLWQFMLPTAKNSGLEINSLIDERFDPVRSTDAACIYFQRLYDIFKNWHLAIAAYNCGEGAVLRAIRRSGGNRDFWRIYPHLPRETRSYLPYYMAAAYVMEYHEEHGICPIMPDFSVSIDTLMVERNLTFEQIANILQIDKETIKFYNPQYKREIIPGSIKPSTLCLPVKNLYTDIEDGKDSARTSRLDELMAVCTPAADAETEQIQTDEPQYISYTVKSGDTLSGIASKYRGVTVKKIQTANKMTTTRLKIGQILKIPQA
ncbi:MAG: transglycosylase SLT domain-containing protein [Tannerella sp.]|jgi:membrane-bound lytic murein transglycosylase D|nr:transglycosylase SLT domain-containing protein [Tannerella sp.]